MKIVRFDSATGEPEKASKWFVAYQWRDADGVWHQQQTPRYSDFRRAQSHALKIMVVSYDDHTVRNLSIRGEE